MAVGVHKHVLGLNVSVADALGVDVCDRAQQLVRVQFYQQIGHLLLHFEVLLHNFVNGVGDEVHDDVEVDLLSLVSIGVEVLPNLDTVLVVQQLQYLQLSVLVALVLENLLDGHGLARLCDRCFKDHPEGARTNDFLCVVCQTLL